MGGLIYRWGKRAKIQKYKTNSNKYKTNSNKYKINSNKYKTNSNKYKTNSSNYKANCSKYSAKSNKYSTNCNKYIAITSITTCLQTGYFNHAPGTTCVGYYLSRPDPLVYPSIENIWQ